MELKCLFNINCIAEEKYSFNFVTKQGRTHIMCVKVLDTNMFDIWYWLKYKTRLDMFFFIWYINFLLPCVLIEAGISWKLRSSVDIYFFDFLMNISWSSLFMFVYTASMFWILTLNSGQPGLNSVMFTYHSILKPFVEAPSDVIQTESVFGTSCILSLIKTC